MLASPGAEHPGAEALPGTRAVEGVVAAAVRLAGVLGAAATSAAGDDGADRAQLHRLPCPAVPWVTLVTPECTPVDIAMSVNHPDPTVYSPAVLHPEATRPRARPALCAASSTLWTMPRSRLPSLAVLGALVLAALALSHELIYLIAHGIGEGYAQAMREGGHDRYWTSFLLVVAVVTTALAVVTVTQWRRLRRLAAAMRAGGLRVGDAGRSRFLGLLSPLWLRLSVAVVVTYVLQENIETASTGVGLPGLGVLAGEHAIALPILLAVSLLVAAVGALVGWRREIILARLREAARGRLRATPSVLRPAQTHERPAGTSERRRNGVRAPPSAIELPRVILPAIG